LVRTSSAWLAQAKAPATSITALIIDFISFPRPQVKTRGRVGKRLQSATMRRVIFAIVVAMSLGAASVAGAQGESAETYFREAEVAYNVGRFDDAIAGYEKAYELSKLPALLFNLAQAHRLAGHSQQAIYLYRNYLRQVPQAKNRAAVEAQIKKLESEPVVVSPPEQTEAPATTPAPLPAPAAQPVPRPVVQPAPVVAPVTATQAAPPSMWTTQRKVAVVVAGAGVVATGIGIAFLASSGSASDTVNDAIANGTPWTPDLDDTLTSGQRNENIGTGLVIGGASAVAIGAVLYWLGAPADAPQVAVTGTYATVAFRF
jgi:tetratricopeptide (TPR) repeat protein